MSSIAYVLVILLSIESRVYSKAMCEDDGLSIADLRKAKDESRREQVRRELSSEDEEGSEEAPPPRGTTEKSSGEEYKLSSKMSANGGPPDLKKAMENAMKKAMEDSDPSMKEAMKKSKRAICDRILQQLRDLPCDNPVLITCGGENRIYPCSGVGSESPLRAALSEVDNILEAAHAVPQPLLQQPAVFPSPDGVSPVQTLPVSSPSMAANLVPGVGAVISQDIQPVRPYMPQTRILTAEERRERQKGIFEGLLRFGTVVNHIDSFITDKSKMIIKGLHRMVQSEEDSRFN